MAEIIDTSNPEALKASNADLAQKLQIVKKIYRDDQVADTDRYVETIEALEDIYASMRMRLYGAEDAYTTELKDPVEASLLEKFDQGYVKRMGHLAGQTEVISALAS